MITTDAANLIHKEFLRAQEKFPPFTSAHEGYAIIKEELDKLWEGIKEAGPIKPGSDDRYIRTEVTQVAAMAMRFLTDICK